MMNKQDVLDYASEEIRTHQKNNYFQRGYRTAMRRAYDRVKQIDEPEKPVLSKEEAEWLERLKKAKSFLNCLYIITRQGWGHDFEFYVHEEKYKLSYRDDNDEDSEQTKNRLVNALIYGYEVEKEKRYTAKLKISNEYLSYDKDYKEICHYKIPDDVANKVKAYHFIEDDLVKYHIWGNEAYEVKEVKE